MLLSMLLAAVFIQPIQAADSRVKDATSNRHDKFREALAQFDLLDAELIAGLNLLKSQATEMPASALDDYFFYYLHGYYGHPKSDSFFHRLSKARKEYSNIELLDYSKENFPKTPEELARQIDIALSKARATSSEACFLKDGSFNVSSPPCLDRGHQDLGAKNGKMYRLYFDEKLNEFHKIHDYDYDNYKLTKRRSNAYWEAASLAGYELEPQDISFSPSYAYREWGIIDDDISNGDEFINRCLPLLKIGDKIKTSRYPIRRLDELKRDLLDRIVPCDEWFEESCKQNKVAAETAEACRRAAEVGYSAPKRRASRDERFDASIDWHRRKKRARAKAPSIFRLGIFMAGVVMASPEVPITKKWAALRCNNAMLSMGMKEEKLDSWRAGKLAKTRARHLPAEEEKRIFEEIEREYADRKAALNKKIDKIRSRCDKKGAVWALPSRLH